MMKIYRTNGVAGQLIEESAAWAEFDSNSVLFVTSPNEYDYFMGMALIEGKALSVVYLEDKDDWLITVGTKFIYLRPYYTEAAYVASLHRCVRFKL